VGDPVTLRIHFVLRLLRLIGFQPQFDECTACERRPQAFQAYWSARQGGLVCESCLREDPNAEPIEPHILETLSACAEDLEPRELDAVSSAVIHQHLDEFLRWRIDRPLKTLGHAGGAMRRRRAPDTIVRA
jgi:recombinational DNA repair protein (RecF pathway)